MYLAGEGRYRDRIRHPLPDLLVLDLKMPGKNGFDVLKWLQSQPIRPLIVVYSDSAERIDVEKALQLGANDYQQKPDSLGKISEWLGNLNDSWARWHAGNGWRQQWSNHLAPREARRRP